MKTPLCVDIQSECLLLLQLMTKKKGKKKRVEKLNPFSPRGFDEVVRDEDMPHNGDCIAPS